MSRLQLLTAGPEGRFTVAVDSEGTISAAAKGGIHEVLIDVNVGLPRCGCDPADAGRLPKPPEPRAWRSWVSWGTRAT